MNNLIVARISNGLGNQLFQYASAYALAKKLNYELLIDDQSAYFKKKDSLRNYELHNFNLSSKIATQQYKFNNYLLDTKRKLLKKIDFLFKKKNFIFEFKDRNKKTFFYDIKISKPANILFMEGYFESALYFEEVKLNIQNEFILKNEQLYANNKYLQIINNNNVVAITIRQHRYSEQKKSKSDIIKGSLKSDKFMKDTINYVKKAVHFFDKKINNPKYLIWSNDFHGLKEYFNDNKFCFVQNDKDKILNDFYLLTKCKYFIVGPTSFGWWGAWLSKYDDKIILRPSDNMLNPSNNLDFWPNKWISV
jgi:hypothetical protein